MTEDWHHARLIPTSGINGADEQERRAATALLAVIGAVGEFGRALTRPLGAPDAAIDTFIEVPFTVRGRVCRPDGLIQARDGMRLWTALVEVRTGSSELDAEQVQIYRELAREQGFDVVLTISNGPGPESIDGVRHCSWREVLAAAKRHQQQRRVVDPNQAWLLRELIRYLEHPRSGVLAGGGENRAEAMAEGRAEDITEAEGVEEKAATGPVRSIDLRDPTMTGLRTVQLGEADLRRPPTPPTRRDLRLIRRLPAMPGRIEAGWYQDPDDPSQLRWWDGVGWSDGRYPAQPVLTVGDV